jgi:hypothetical protein
MDRWFFLYPYMMKRIHLFEFEDLNWFPQFLRGSLTRLVMVMHRLVKSEDALVLLLDEQLKLTGKKKMIDLCSGSGGPLPGVFKRLKMHESLSELEMTLSDLYPNQKVCKEINGCNNGISFDENPVDARNVGEQHDGLRTMICSFHHMRPEIAREILLSAQTDNAPILIYEMSDNGAPKALWWTTIPINIISCLFITPMTKGLTLSQVIFTYLIPIIPICFAWDGAVSNARTYSEDDLDLLLESLPAKDYNWKIGTLGGKPRNIYLKGIPSQA